MLTLLRKKLYYSLIIFCILLTILLTIQINIHEIMKSSAYVTGNVKVNSLLNFCAILDTYYTRRDGAYISSLFFV